ncbi:MAG: HesA/MoeB/ThiF family protein [Thermodesulfobacteriota bacterium]
MMTGRDLNRELEAWAVPRAFPDAAPYSAVDVRTVEVLSGFFGVSGREVEIAALEKEIIPERYVRNFKTFGFEDQVALLRAKVTVIGLGGLGGGVTEILARDGIGRLTLVDGDRFEESNLNRQFLSTRDLLDTPKATAAAHRVARVNPSVEVSAHTLFLNADNGPDLIAGSDVVIDCLDNIKTRLLVEWACKQAGIPLVSAAIAGVAGHLTTIFPEDPGLRLIYGDVEDMEAKGAESTLGTLPHGITILSALECAEAVKIITGRGRPLRNRLLLMDVADYTFQVLELT